MESCNLCSDTTVATEAYLNEHLGTHYIAQTFTCELCRKPSFDLMRHMRYHTVGPDVCPICGKRIFRKANLHVDRHMQRHSGTAKRQCDVSHKVLSCDLLLASHVLGHADLKYKCDVCGKRLTDKTSHEVCTCTAYVLNASTVHRRFPANCRY